MGVILPPKILSACLFYVATACTKRDKMCKIWLCVLLKFPVKIVLDVNVLGQHATPTHADSERF